MKTIRLNGEIKQVEFDTLAELLASLNLAEKRFAVEVNEMIIPKSKLENTFIAEHDQIEIIQAVGGG